MKSRTSMLLRHGPGFKSRQDFSSFAAFESAAVPSMASSRDRSITTALLLLDSKITRRRQPTASTEPPVAFQTGAARLRRSGSQLARSDCAAGLGRFLVLLCRQLPDAGRRDGLARGVSVAADPDALGRIFLTLGRNLRCRVDTVHDHHGASRLVLRSRRREAPNADCDQSARDCKSNFHGCALLGWRILNAPL